MLSKYKCKWERKKIMTCNKALELFSLLCNTNAILMEERMYNAFLKKCNIFHVTATKRIFVQKKLNLM